MAIKLRELAAPFSDDPDYEATQVAPADLIEIVADGKIGIAVTAYNGVAPVTGSCSIQPILVSRTNDATVVTAAFGGFVESSTPTGRLIVVDVRANMRIGVRLSNMSFVGATKALVFWQRVG